ncbi:MAG: rubredoxin-like domain-containing protein [Candidatus Aminicenantales bacterium]
MTPLVRCKVCGFVTAEGKLGDKCPACGAPRAAFEPYTDPVSERRRKFLELTIHPVAVHFPQAFAASMAVLSITPAIFSGTLRDLFLATETILSLFLPFLVAAAILAGLLDGRMRFKRVLRSPILKKKIVLAALFFASSLALALVIWLKAVPVDGFSVWVTLLALLGFLCSFILGLLGTKVAGAIIPGD